VTHRSSARHRLVVGVIGFLTMMSIAGTASAQPHAARGRARHAAHHGQHHGHAKHVRHAKHGRHDGHRLHADHAARHGGLPPIVTGDSVWDGIGTLFIGALLVAVAVVLGIDNVALATHYDWPHAVPPTLRLVRQARALGYAVFFVTGRSEDDAHRLAGPLRRAGFAFEGICGRAHGMRIAPGKTRCRRSLTARGYTITANISTHQQAYVGGYYERAVRLPSYGGRLS